VTPRRHLLTAGAAWVVLSVIGVIVVTGIQIIPVIASREAAIENSAFVVLTAASVPVLMLVVVALAYTALRFRATNETVDGPPIHGHTGFQGVWLGISLILVLFLFIYGAVGLVEIRGAQTADFEVQVQAEQWAWHFEYADKNIHVAELHIPVDRRVHLSHQIGRRDPLVLGAGLRRQAGCRPRSPDADLPDGDEDRDVPRDVRRAVWARPHRHDHHGRGL